MASSKQFGGAEGKENQHEQKSPASELGRSMDRMAESIEGGGSQAAQALRDVREAAEQRAEVLMDWIKRRPLTSVLIGVAVGYLLGRVARH
jgi:ElaB/YqjD/DUF883 family membrane-anchored ribosome-binding protein